MSGDREIDDRIADWVDGRLGGKDRERFEAELRVNPNLRRDLEEYERTVATVRAALQAETAPVQLADRVLAAIASGQRPAARDGVVLRWRPVLWSLVTAAALLVLVVLVDAWSGGAEPKATHIAQQDPAERTREFVSDGREREEDVARAKGELQDGAPRLDVELLLSDKDVQSRTGADEVRLGAAESRRASAPSPEARSEDLDRARDAARRLRAGSKEGDGTGGAVPPAPSRLSKSVPPSAVEPPNDEEKGIVDRGIVERGIVERGIEERTEGARERPFAPVRPRASGAPNETVAPSDDAADEPELRMAGEVDDSFAQGVTGSSLGLGVPMPLVVVQGRAPDQEMLFRLRQRMVERGGRAASKQAADDVDTARRVDDFLTAQVAEVGRPAARAENVRKAPSPQVAPDAAAAAAEAPSPWVRVAALRLRALEPAAGADGTARADQPGGAGVTWNERDWLVEGTRQDIAALLQRLATFVGESRLELRSSETRAVPAELLGEARPGAELERQQAAEPTRIVLRFRLQAR